MLDCGWRRKHRLYKGQHDGGGGGCVGFFLVCLELLGREGWGFEVFGGLFCFGWLAWFCFFCMLLQKRVYEINVCREVHFQSHGRIKCF